MTLKILIAILLLTAFIFLYCSLPKPTETPEKPMDKAWWDGLSPEWKSILLINQYFHQQQVDFDKVQNEYLNRMRGDSAENYHTEFNTALRELHEKKKYLLSYEDMYNRVIKGQDAVASDSIDLGSLHQLTKLYMVSGPGDLRPLQKFPNLEVLIINYCGIEPTVPFSELELDLEPLRKLKQLKYLYCSSPTLTSIEPLKALTNLVYLDCSISNVTSLEPLKNLRNLEGLSFGSKVKKADVITRLHNLNELYMDGCKKIPDLSALKKLKKLAIVENEMALVDGNYRIHDLGFLQNLSALEFLDMDLTSYKGSLEHLKNLRQLKAITLPRVSTVEVAAFKRERKDCIVVNGYEFE